MGAQLVYDCFPHLTPTQKEQFALLGPLYAKWNACINVISRKDIDSLYVHHVLHSLALAFVNGDPFAPGHRILDVGTGGGFPGVPLAILFPQARFTLCDSIGKKIKVVTEICSELQLTNVTPVVSRAESLPPESYHTIVSRAVTTLAQFLPWIRRYVAKDGCVLCLKGGDLTQEIAEASALCRIPPHLFKEYSIASLFPAVRDDFFTTKKICEIKQTSYLCTPILGSKSTSLKGK